MEMWPDYNSIDIYRTFTDLPTIFPKFTDKIFFTEVFIELGPNADRRDDRNRRNFFSTGQRGPKMVDTQIIQ